MRRILISLTAALLMVPALFSQNRGETESLVSSEVNAFVQTGEIAGLLKNVNYTINHLFDEQTRSQVFLQRDEFRDKTGIDFLNEASLRNNGIDTSRPLSVAFYPDDNQRDVFILFVPVYNEKEFPLKFDSIRKKSISDTGNYSVPLKSVYRGVTVYKQAEDLFTTAFNGYFLMGSTFEVVQKAIDLKSAGTDSLILENSYKDYLLTVNRNNDINVYFSPNSLASLNTRSARDQYEGEEGYVAGDKAMERHIKYISAGVRLEGKIIKMNSMFRLTRGNREIDLFLDLLQSGVNRRALSVPYADISMALGLNLSVLEKFCGGGNPECADYASYKDQFRQTTGIDFAGEFLPNFSGTVNLLMTDADGMADMVLFIPMSDAKKTEAIWNRLKKKAKEVYGPQKMYGEEKVGGKSAFWIMDAARIKYYTLFDGRGMYFGNSIKLMTASMKSGVLSAAKESGSLSRIVNDNTVMFIKIKNTAILSQLTGMYTGNASMGKIFSGIKEITFRSDKSSEGLTLNMEVELKGNQQ